MRNIFRGTFNKLQAIGISRVFIPLFLCFETVSYGQGKDTDRITMNDLVSLATSQNPMTKSFQLKTETIAKQKTSAFALGPMDVDYKYGWSNSPLFERDFEINQDIGSPMAEIQNLKYAGVLNEAEKAGQLIALKKLTAEVKTAYTNWDFCFIKMRMLGSFSVVLDSIFKVQNDSTGDEIRFDNLETQDKYARFENDLFQARQEYKIATNQVRQLIYSNQIINPADTILEMYAIRADRKGVEKFYPVQQFYYLNEQEDLKAAMINVVKSGYYPTLRIGYFNQKIGNMGPFHGYRIGLSIPVSFWSQRDKVLQAKIDFEDTRNQNDYRKFVIQHTIENLKSKLDQLFVYIGYYRESALPLADQTERAVFLKLKNREIDQFLFLKDMNKVIRTRLDFLEKIKDYNLTAIQLEYYIN